ncbi:MAG: TSUP family transporter [Desulfamplus sp.]|nr:TSUP family transporter [Desulfamplus sp.]
MKKLIIIIAVIVSAIFAQALEGGITTASGSTGEELLLNFQESISQAVAKVRPSVVSVRAQKKQQAAGGGQNDFVWFESIGSGFIVDKRGYILTNRHVVNGSENIEISLWRSQDNIFSAKIMDEDENLDLALLKIEPNQNSQALQSLQVAQNSQAFQSFPQNLQPAQGLSASQGFQASQGFPAPQMFPAAELGNSNEVKTGNYLICIGSPFGFDHTVTMGIVSDLHREMVIDGVTYKDMIQTDAVINEGNSGGPVIDIYGRVVGVGTAIYAPDGTYRGIGFAIPINRTKHFFSRVTGVVITAASSPVVTAASPVITAAGSPVITAAATATATPIQQTAQTKEPVNLNKKMPNDAIHKEFSDCTACHTITQKMVVSMKTPMPHPPVGSCDICHILTNDPVTQGPMPVAALVPMQGQGIPVASPLISIAGGAAVNQPLDNSINQSINQLSIVPKTAFSTLNETFSVLFTSIILKLGLMAFVASIVFSMLGLGGGFVYVPLLLSCGIDFYTAASTSLMMITLSQISSLYTFSKSGLVDLKLAAVLEPPTMVGAFVGGMVAHYFNIDVLSIMFSCTLFIASYTMMQNNQMQTTDESHDRLSISPFKWHHEFKGRPVDIDLGFTIPVTFITGFFGGLLGLAASWIKIPIMVLMLNIPMKIAIATASLMVPLTALSGFLGHSLAGNFDIRLAITLSAITVVGAQIGSRLARGSDSNLLRFIFAFVLSVVGVWMILRVF